MNGSKGEQIAPSGCIPKEEEQEALPIPTQGTTILEENRKHSF